MDMRRQFRREVRLGLACVLSIVGVMSLLGLGDDGSARADTTTIEEVAIASFAFNPATVTVTTGSSVRWTNNDGVDHTSTSDTGVWDSGALSLSDLFTQTFDATGVYSYHCDIHPSMLGRVVVITSTWTVCSSGCNFTSIGAALAAAGNGDLIRVTSGSYLERLTITKTVTLQGGWDASFATRTPGESVVDAQRLGRALTILGPISPTIDGFTLTGGNATFEISGAHHGGGVYVEAGGALLTNNIITNNLATTSTILAERGRGGGVYVESGSVVISANQIVSNVAGAAEPGPTVEGFGGGVFAAGAPSVINNLIASNQARSSGASFGYGGGAHVSNGVVRGNQFISNSASNGGGIATLANTLFDGNLARGAGSGIGATATPVEVVNNTIVGYLTGVNVNPGAAPTISNNLFYSDTTAIQIVTDGVVTPTLDYNGFWQNGADFDVTTGTLTGTHNVFADPLFVNPAAGDYHLGPGSPLINQGTGAGAPVNDYDGDARPTGGGVDIGADEVLFKILLPLLFKS
jgi:plastocyanin